VVILTCRVASVSYKENFTGIRMKYNMQIRIGFNGGCAILYLLRIVSVMKLSCLFVEMSGERVKQGYLEKFASTLSFT